MITRFILTMIGFMIGLSCYADETLTESKTVSIPSGCEETYNNFVYKFTRKNENPEKLPFGNKLPDMSFDLQYATVGKFPVILSEEPYRATEALEERYKTYKKYHGKTVEANDKMYEERFNQKQEEIRTIFNDLLKNNAQKDYLILAGILSVDNGEKISKDRYIIILNPKYNDREWALWKIDQNMQKRVALTLTSTDGTAMEFMDSDRDLDNISGKYNDPIINFILSKLNQKSIGTNIPFFSNN